jgi:tetratricopeptide (TPR) repeat protein
MQRLTPLLKPAAAAPIEFAYKSDVVALVTECLIKAIEARTMDVGFAPPAKPANTRDREAEEHYTVQLAAYQRSAEVVRRKQADLDMRQGWVLTDYFYTQLQSFEHSPDSLGETMGQMVYGMDVERVRHQAEQIDFLPVGSGELVARVSQAPTGMMLAEKMMLEGKLDAAEAIADKALADPKADHAEALYVKARVSLLENDPETSFNQFEQILAVSREPRTSAWAHIYLGRLYDIKTPAQRGRAVAEYKAALQVPGIQPDATAAAENGLRKAFSVPKVVHEDEEPLDPSGKAEKEAYRPDPPAKGTPPKN